MCPSISFHSCNGTVLPTNVFVNPALPWVWYLPCHSVIWHICQLTISSMPSQGLGLAYICPVLALLTAQVRRASTSHDLACAALTAESSI